MDDIDHNVSCTHRNKFKDKQNLDEESGGVRRRVRRGQKRSQKRRKGRRRRTFDVQAVMGIRLEMREFTKGRHPFSLSTSLVTSLSMSIR